MDYPCRMSVFFIDFRNSGLMKVFVVKDKDLTVGGSFCVVLEGKAVYTFYYCGLRNYKLKTYPTHLAVLAALQYGIENGLKYLDFMGAGRPENEYGVRDYKIQFGGELVEYGRFLFVCQPRMYRLGKFITDKILKRKCSSN